MVDESLWEGVAVGAPLGFPGNGRPLSFRILHVFEVTDDGAIARENVWLDYPAIARQLGASEPPETSEDTRSVVLRMYEELDRGALGDFDAVDPDFSAQVVARAEPLDWEEFTRFGRAFLDAFPDGRHVFEQVVTEGNVVTTLGTYEGTHEGDLQGLAPTHRSVKFPVMHLDRVVGGKIVEHRGLGDLTIMMQQLGAAG